MDSSSKSQPDPKLSPLTVPVAYHHSLPHIGYGPHFFSFFSQCERDGRVIPVLVPTFSGDEICWASPSAISPSCYPTIPDCTPHELPSSEQEQGADDSPVFLTDKELWRAFYEVGTEMIVNKNGRRLFPSVKVTITGLIPSVMYNVKAKFVCASKYHYKFLFGKWKVKRESKIIHDESRMEFVHPSSPANGEMWMKKPVSFEAIRLTHKENSKGGNILLHTMHKYNINIIIQPLDSSMEEMVYPLANSTFTAVSCYNSGKVTKLKMEHNPFARRAYTNHERFIVPSNPVCPPMLSAFPAPGLATPFPVIQPIITGFVPPDQRPSQPEIKDPEIPFPVMQPIITGFVPPRPEISNPDTPFPTIQPIITGFVQPYQRPSQPETEDSDKTVYNSSESYSNSSY